MTYWAIFGTLLLGRVATFVALLPIVGGQRLPVLVRIGLTGTLAVVWAVAIGMDPRAHQWLLQNANVHWFVLIVAVAREMILGALLAYLFGLFLLPAQIAGEFLSQEMGLSFGSFVNPSEAISGSTLTQLFELLASILFLGLDFHHTFLQAFDNTLVNFPLGEGLVEAPLEFIVAGTARASEWGLLLAAPIGLCLFLTTVILALINRASPQMNMFSVGFTLRIGVGLIALMLLFPSFITAIVAVFGGVRDYIWA